MIHLLHAIETGAYLLLALLAWALGLTVRALSWAVDPILALERRWRPRNIQRIRSAQAALRARLAQRIAPADPGQTTS